MPRQFPRLALAALFPVIAAACSPRASAPAPVSVAVAPVAVAPPPRGSACGQAIGQTQAVVESDVATQNLNKSVGEKFGADLSVAADACRAGRDREALGLLASAKARYGYQ